jgi:chromosome segregation ATPase
MSKPAQVVSNDDILVQVNALTERMGALMRQNQAMSATIDVLVTSNDSLIKLVSTLTSSSSSSSSSSGGVSSNISQNGQLVVVPKPNALIAKQSVLHERIANLESQHAVVAHQMTDIETCSTSTVSRQKALTSKCLELTRQIAIASKQSAQTAVESHETASKIPDLTSKYCSLQKRVTSLSGAVRDVSTRNVVQSTALTAQYVSTKAQQTALGEKVKGVTRSSVALKGKVQALTVAYGGKNVYK